MGVFSASGGGALALLRDYFILTINGSIVPWDMVSTLQFVDEEGVESDRVEVSLRPDYPKPAPMDVVTLILVNIHGFMNCGTFYVQSVNRRDNLFLSFSATSAEFNTNQKKKYSQNYEKTTLSGIVAIVVGRLGKTLKWDAPDYYIESMNQTDERDVTFLERLAKEHDVLFSIKNGKGYFVSKTSGSLPSFSVDASRASSSDIRDSQKPKFNGVEAKYWDKKEGKTEVVTLGGAPLMELREAYTNKDEARVKGTAILNTSRRLEITGSLEIRGQKLYAGTKMTLYNTYQGESDGLYYIESVTHDFSKDGGWTASLEFRKYG